MHRTTATVVAIATLFSLAPSVGQTEPAESAAHLEIEESVRILGKSTPRLQLGVLDGLGPPSLALAAQAARLTAIPEGEDGIHGWWSTITLDAGGKPGICPSGDSREPLESPFPESTPEAPPWISGGHFGARALVDAHLVEGLAGIASVDLGGDPGAPVNVSFGLHGGYFSARVRPASGTVRVGYSRSLWLRNLLSPGSTVDEVALVHGQFIDQGGAANRYYGALLDNGSGSADVGEGYGLYMTPVPGETRWGIYQAGSERNMFHGPVEIRSDLRVTGRVLVGPDGEAAACAPADAAYREVTAPARLTDLGPRTVVALTAAEQGILELDGAAPGAEIEVVRVDPCPAAPSAVHWTGGSASAGCEGSLRLLRIAGTWRQVR